MNTPMFKLNQNPAGRGLRCDTEGLFLAGEPLLERDENNHFQPRPPLEIRKVLSAAFHIEGDWDSSIRSTEVVAKALNSGDLARAMMAAVLMRLPDPNDVLFVSDAGAGLAKAGFNPDEPRDEHGRWTSGGDSDDAKLIPAQVTTTMDIPMDEPLFGPIVRPQIRGAVRPFPGTIDVPPIVVPNSSPYSRPNNPYPNRPECVQEWAEARKFCNDLVRRKKLGTQGYRQYGTTYEQCLMGQVSEDCGGNPTGEVA